MLKLQDNVADSFETLLSSVNKLKEIPDTKLESIYEDTLTSTEVTQNWNAFKGRFGY